MNCTAAETHFKGSSIQSIFGVSVNNRDDRTIGGFGVQRFFTCGCLGGSNWFDSNPYSVSTFFFVGIRENGLWRVSALQVRAVCCSGEIAVWIGDPSG